MAEVPEKICQQKCCQSCGHSSRLMKRCIQCREAIYCSRECQVKDWPSHKAACLKPLLDSNNTNKYLQNRRPRFTKSIFDDDEESERKTGAVVDQEQNEVDINQSSESKDKPGFLYHNEFYHDVPKLNPDSDHCCVTVKANKEKHSIKLQTSWSGHDIFKVFACEVKIPLDKLKVIHKGKMINKDNISQLVKPRAVFHVIGEQAANEDGLDKCDISLMMKQLGIDRNTAVVSLRKSGNLVDAIFDIGNK